ncbi:MAG: glycosyltransferase [Prevotellaceae bacterium]|jgi:glycosyltransferase involved in cell wall biosynthesis|nr:glycosyltransferase [Prevotellaceae bacterium]
MEILHVINNLNTGGAEKLLVESVPFYQRKGLKVDVLLLNGIDTALKQQLEKETAGRIFSTGNSNIYNPFLIFKLIPFIKRYDIVHGHLFPVLYWLAFAKLLGRAGAALVYTEHSTTNSRRNKSAFRFLDRRAYSVCDKIVCISRKTEENLAQYIGEKYREKFLTVRNGVNLSAVANAQASPDLCEGDVKIVMVARFHRAKDQNTVIKSLLYLDKNVHAYFVGDGSLISESKSLTQRLNLTDRVHFLGNRNDVPSLLKAASVVVLSSNWEGFGLSSVEGMAAGKPLVASDIDGLRETVTGAGLLFKRGDAKELADKIRSLTADPDFYSCVAAKCLEKSGQYDIAVMTDRYAEVYSDLLKTRIE